MKADITRSTFHPEKHYLKVNMQQGRVLVDADWNEQIDILIHQQRCSLRKIIGKTGTSLEQPGFQIKTVKNEYMIGPGYYFIDGILIENNCGTDGILANNQPDLPEFNGNTPRIKGNSGLYIVYLDVWERHITAIDDPTIRDVALGGADTSTRTKIIWQVKAALINASDEPQLTSKNLYGSLQALSYQGDENRLYRVEIHDSGSPGENATFKWSRDNGVVVAKISPIENGNYVTLCERVDPTKFSTGQWVELSDDCHELWGLPGTLVQIETIKDHTITFNPTTLTGKLISKKIFPKNPKIRRWDSQGLMKVETPSDNEGYIELEDGIQIKFGSGFYQTGDYWLLPARTAIGDIEWPKEEGTNNPVELPQARIEHHYCKLAKLKFDNLNRTLEMVTDYRTFFTPIVNLQETIPTSGVVTIELPNEQCEVISGPIKHFLTNLKTPPLIILDYVNKTPIAHINKIDQKAKVIPITGKNNITVPECSPTNVNLENFQIKFKSTHAESVLNLRWWAIPSSEQTPQLTRATKF